MCIRDSHYPYTTSLSGDDLGFPLAKTQDETINGYFATANYLDSSIKAFFDYLKESGLYKNSIIDVYKRQHLSYDYQPWGVLPQSVHPCL